MSRSDDALVRQLMRSMERFGPIPDLPGAACKGVAGFTEQPVKEQLRKCRECPEVTGCLEMGIRDVAPTGPGEFRRNNAVFGGTRPSRIVEMAS